MHNFTVEIINDSFIFRLQPKHYQTVYIRSITGNYIPVVHKQIQKIFLQDTGITCKGICDCYTW